MVFSKVMNSQIYEKYEKIDKNRPMKLSNRVASGGLDCKCSQKHPKPGTSAGEATLAGKHRGLPGVSRGVDDGVIWCLSIFLGLEVRSGTACTQHPFVTPD